LFLVVAKGGLLGDAVSVNSKCFTSAPTAVPTGVPTFRPTPVPTSQPSFVPTFKPSSAKPSPSPTFRPTPVPTFKPSADPTNEPTSNPTECKDVVTVIDFDGLAGGSIVSSLPGVTIVGRGPSSDGNSATILDDDDGERFDDGQGKVLIVSSQDTDDPNGVVDVVDSATGGTLFFHFDHSVGLWSFVLLGVKQDEIGSVTLFDEFSKILFSAAISGNGANSKVTIDLGGTKNVKSMVIRLVGPGAIDDIEYFIPCKP